MKRILALIVAVLALTRPALAEDIRIDLSNYLSLTPGNWNNIGNIAGLTNNLVDFPTGNVTNVSIDGTGSPWQDFYGDDPVTFPNQDWLIQPATQDGAGLQQGQTGTYVISNLAYTYYKVEIVSARTSFDYLNTITVNGALADRTYQGTPVVTPWGSTTDGLTPSNWLIWDNVMAINGVITIMDVADANTLGILNAIRIVTVPEPASFAMAGIGAAFILAAIGRRRGRIA